MFLSRRFITTRTIATVTIKVMCPKIGLPPWEYGPEELRNINMDIAKKYRLSNLSLIPYYHYLWIVNQIREDKKWIPVWITMDSNTSDMYILFNLNRIFAKRNSIKAYDILANKRFKRINKAFIQKILPKPYIFVKVNYPYDDNNMLLTLPIYYAIKYNIKENDTISWKTYINYCKNLQNS